MKFEEVLPTLKEGKKIRRESWGNKQLYYYVDFNGEKDKLKSSSDIYREVELNYLELTATDWEIYEEPLLTEEEKKFIKNILDFINDETIEYIYLSYVEGMNAYILYFEDILPLARYKFISHKANLFKNLELNRYYTLKELGLDE